MQHVGLTGLRIHHCSHAATSFPSASIGPGMLAPRGSPARTKNCLARWAGSRRLLPQLLVGGDESAGDVRLAFDQFDQSQASLSAEHEETVAIDALELPCPGPLIVCEREPLVLLRQADPVDPGHDVCQFVVS